MSVKKRSIWRTHSVETKELMNQNHIGSQNAMYGRSQSIETKILQRLAREGKVNSVATRKAISITNGTPVYLYVACSNNPHNSLCFSQKFSSTREVGKYFKISHSTVSRYLKSGKLLSKNNSLYKLSYNLLTETA